MTYKGHVENGVVVLDDAVQLDDGVAVQVEVLGGTRAESLHPDIIRFTGILPPGIDVQEEYIEIMKNKHT